MKERIRVERLQRYGLALILLASVSGCVATHSTMHRKHKPTVLRSEDFDWRERSSGVEVATLYGDPSKRGRFVLRLRYPAGYRKEPHYHPRDAHVTVLSGSYFRGYGDKFVKSSAIKLSPGTFSINPAGVSHYEWTTEPAELEVHAMGPWATVYVDADDQAIARD